MVHTSQPIRISSFDPLSAGRDLWEQFHVYRRAAAAALSPGDPILSDDEVEIEQTRQDPLWTSRRWIAREGETVVGSMRVGFRQPKSPFANDYAPFLGGGGTVLAPWTRRGVATALLREVHGLMHAMGKTTLTLSAHTESGHAFLRRVGAQEKHRSVENRARFDRLDWAQLRMWEDEALGAGLSWERHAGRVPEPVLQALLPELTRLVADIPLGGLQHAPLRYEMNGYRSWYETMDRIGGAHHVVVLRGPKGEVAGICEAGWDTRTPDRAWQQLTAVSREWRRHGLAKALKAAMLRQVHAMHPQVAIMVTHNAEVNAPILSINARVGFALHQCNVDYQVTRDALDAWSLA